MSSPIKIYWANALFGQADRNFNAECAATLRKAGYELFLPQESVAETDIAATSDIIFEADSAAIYAADMIVACIDQETIDCGVACEIGIGHTLGMPIIGLYTDIRQNRPNECRMYKNVFVVGAIKSAGKLVASMDELLTALDEYRIKGIVKKPRIK